MAASGFAKKRAMPPSVPPDGKDSRLGELLLPRRREQGEIEGMTRIHVFSFIFMTIASPALAEPQALGVFGNWGAFSDRGRCYAIAEPVDAPPTGAWRPFAAIGHAPGRRTGGQANFRLSREKRSGSAVLLNIDGRSFQLVGGGRDAWAADAAADRDIQGAMRTGVDMVVETRSADGLLVRDHYRLRGAATAMDAAAIACAPRR